jgi:beta-ureidopropionase
MDPIHIATAQFENHSNEKPYNLLQIEKLASVAAGQGAQVVAFHECSISGYSFARKLTFDQLLDVAEPVPGPSVQRLIEIARRLNLILLAGLFEKDRDQKVYNSYVCVDGNAVLACHRKLHPFIHPELSPGPSYTVFDCLGWRMGILTCYDNNIIENVRATALLGADLIFMPHVTMCTPSTRPGAGFVDPALWRNRERDPTTLRLEFDGMKGRSWLMKWLPARAYDNGIYVVFSNPIGMDDDQLKNGCSMIIDPFGDIIGECRALDNEVVTVGVYPDRLQLSGGYRYRQARRPDLYGTILGRNHEPKQKVAWLHTNGSH